jgi:alkanesulfonate monooxygenase SsuD/methylene tetrahydromethanopterin reductase-like flavin-dependent oxidoreductase (luciferase family)
MKFGLFGSAAAQRGVSDVESAAGYKDFIDFVIEAEALGYGSMFVVEHHFTGFGQVSATLNLLTYIAAKTSTIRLGTAVTVLPWHNPVLLAEQAATLDLLSGGRLDFGVGKGYRHNEFEGFCIPMEEAEARFEEAFEVIIKGWTSNERFSHRGKYWNFENVIVEPPTAQKPHPPIWMGAGSPPSIRRVAERSSNLLLDQFAPIEAIGERVALFRQEVENGGRPFDPMSVAVARGLHIARDDADKDAAMAQRLKGQERLRRISERPGGDNKASMLTYADTREVSEEATLFGTIDAIAAKLDRLRALGVEHVLLNVFGASRANLRGFAKHLMPAFRDTGAAREGAQKAAVVRA